MTAEHEAFEKWWFDHGSGLCVLPSEDNETHARRVSEAAWMERARKDKPSTPQPEEPVDLIL